jgi:octaprenyl-diphosphate synthase
MLTLAMAEAFGYRGDGDVKLATAVEFMHTATLLHDDVVDESGMRRGRPAARMIWGNQASVLVGDFLLGQAFKLMVEVGSLPALRIFSDAAATISEGEVLQLSGVGKIDLGEAHYMAVINAKTAALFAAATAAGPILAGAAPSREEAAAGFGLNLGIAFQLIDDVLDFSGDAEALGKNVGDDLREGKATLPVLFAFARGGEDDRAFWRRAIETREIGEADVARAVRLVRETGALADATRRARGFGEAALDHLEALPAHEMRDILAEVVTYTIDRVR